MVLPVSMADRKFTQLILQHYSYYRRRSEKMPYHGEIAYNTGFGGAMLITNPTYDEKPGQNEESITFNVRTTEKNKVSKYCSKFLCSNCPPFIKVYNRAVFLTNCN